MFLLLSAFYFYGLGHFPLVGPDEPRYAAVAREMYQRGDLITPTLGGHTWFEKPVLLYWLMEVSFRLFGISEASIRLGPALCGLMTLAAVYWLGKRVERVSQDDQLCWFACSSTLLLGTMFGTIVFSRGASFDIVVTMTLTWAFCFFLAAIIAEEDRERRRLLIGFYASVGLSLLAKGLVGIAIPVGVAGLYYLLRRSLPDRLIRRSVLWGVPLVLFVSAVWYAPVIAKHGWSFIDQFFIQHHFARYISDKYHHPQRFYFYIPIGLALSLPWLPLVIKALVESVRLNWHGDSVIERVLVFSFAWIGGPLIFFSLSRSKLPGYILPVLPALALLVGYQVAKILAIKEDRSTAVRLTAALFILLAAGVVVYAAISRMLSIGSAIFIVIPAIAAGLIALLTKSNRLAIAALIVAVPITFTLALKIGAPKIAAGYSTRDLFARASERGYGTAAVYQLHDIDRGAEFYASGRLVYDANGEPLKFEGVSPIVEASRQKRQTVLVIVPVRYAGQLTSLSQAEVERIADNGEFAIIAVKAKD
jgi:4-amino-4-deoxy-L-arabinose transferase-like glycosyltransferase